MVRRLASLAFTLGALVALNACITGYAELVRRDQTGGILALKGDRQTAMQDAQAQMQAHCGGPYTVVSEENAVVGEQTQTNAQAYGGQHYASGSSASQTTAVTEYRLTYTCGAAAPPAAPVAVQAAPPPQPPAPPPAAGGGVTVQGGASVGVQ